MPDTPEPLDLASHNIATDRLADLVRLFPEIRTEGGKIDFDRLKVALGEAVDVGKERYGMNWPGKAECFKTIQSPSLGTLLPAPEESVNFDTTENMIIEGDNLEVLKLLQKSYMGRVKMIYIDPPYNTGNDFIYPDNYSESLQTYLEYTGQVDAQGRRFGTNTDADGRFHSKWMNMMYPRLYLARNLLKEDGVIFISVDDAEIANLRRICDEVFGEESFVAQFCWKSRKFPDSRAKTGVSTDHEYILLYAKSPAGVLQGLERDEAKFSNPDNDSRGPWMSRSMLGLANKAKRPNLHYLVVDPSTNEQFAPPEDTGWRYSADRMERMISEGRVLFPKDGSGRPREKKFRSDMQNDFIAFPTMIDGVHTSDGTSEIRELFGEDLFDFAKPSELLERLVSQGTSASVETETEHEIILDFFAGSGATAQAVLSLNKKSGSSRRFILVQLPEPTERADFTTIAEITKERVRRVIKKIESEQDGKLDLDKASLQDLGFKVFKLAPSNFTTWDAQAAKDADALANQLDLHIDHIRLGRQPHEILNEIILKSGYPLTTRVETLTIEGKPVFSVADGGFLVCLEEGLTLELIKALASREAARVVCLDAGFKDNDELKTNAVQTFRSKNIVFKTV